MSTPQLLAARRQLKARLLLTAPAMLVLLVFLLAPLAIMFLVSILQSGDYGGVVWGQYSLDAYINFLYERDLDDSWVFNTDYLQIFQRSLLLSLLTTAGCL
ncbi:MAG: ABC transporter permease, partial [Pseudomonas sp. PGPPP3]